MLKIVYIINRLDRGGAEKNLYQIISSLGKNHYEFSIITLLNKGTFEKPFERLGVPITNLNMEGPLLSPINFCRYCTLIRIIRAYKPDVIHAFLFSSNLVATSLKILFPSLKIIVTKVGYNTCRKKLHFFASNKIYRYCDLVMVNTGTLRDEILQNKAFAYKIKIIPNGIDLNINQDGIKIASLLSEIKRDRKTIVGCVGRFAPEKRYIDVIEAAKILVRDNSNVHFLLVGGRGNFAECQYIVRKLAIQSYVTFTDEVDNVLSYVKGFDIFLTASVSEGMPNSVMEAMLMGRPIIATRVGGIPELIEDGVNGLLVPPNKPHEIVGALKELLNNENLRRKMSSNNLKKIRNFSIEEMVSKVNKMYSDLISK